MRRGFTIIELVFVIVIIGILAAVALPRFVGISDDSRTAKLVAFTGALNRSVGPSVWSSVQRLEPTRNGSVKNATLAKHNTLGTPASALGADAQLDSIPAELGAITTLDLTKCADSNQTIPAIGDTGGGALGGALKESVTIGTTKYTLGCVDSSLSLSPTFYLYDSGGTSSPTNDQIIMK
jgi:prepilin-type N-terminal cleavage/methylation domain-containing protein